ncbi:MAG: DUF3429 family protein [Gammaproteobacteria bacterium]|nr:MAG: DUF3429 family protein [Gammaproteobacteria bacterium]
MADDSLATRIAAAGRDARVVLLGSGLTDFREPEQRLEQAGVSHTTLRLSMGPQANRDEFRELTEQTGARLLPQCFLDGKHVGGPLELYARLGLTAPVGTGSGERLIGLAQALGYGGLIPFLVGGALALLFGNRPVFGVDPVFFVASYAAVILAFVGAVHWGVALAGPVRPLKARLMLGLSVLPALVGWVALLAGPESAPALLVLLAGFVGWWLYEWMVPGKRILARWYVRLRLQLSAVASLVLLVVWLRLLLG